VVHHPQGTASRFFRTRTRATVSGIEVGTGVVQKTDMVDQDDTVGEEDFIEQFKGSKRHFRKWHWKQNGSSNKGK
jgi:hypothetical protein